MKQTFIALMICFSLNVKMIAQKVYNYNLPGTDCYSEMIFINSAILPKGVIVIDVKGADIISYSQNNAYINSGLFKNYNFLFLNVLIQKTSNVMSCYEVIINGISNVHRIYPSVFYLLKKVNKKESIIIKKANDENYPFNSIEDNNLELKDLLLALNEATLNQIYYIPSYINSVTDQEIELRMMNYKRNFDLGIYISPVFLTGAKLGLSKNAISNYGLSFAKNIGQQFAIKGDIGGTIKRPDQSGIQSGLQSTIMSARQRDEDSIFIDQTLSGHILIGGDLNLKYYFEKKKHFRPFAAMGIGAYRLTNISGRIQDTIDISNIDLSNPSAAQSALGGGTSASETPAGMSNITTPFIVPQFEIGFEYRLAPAVKTNVSIPFKYFQDRTTRNLSSFTWGINFGLSFTLNSKKLPKKLHFKKTS